MKWLPHFHHDPNYQARGPHLYFECRCGARRVVHHVRNMGGPVQAGWPTLTDRHGMPVRDTRWRPARAPVDR